MQEEIKLMRQSKRLCFSLIIQRGKHLITVKRMGTYKSVPRVPS